jgi:hypothetical protein
VYFKIIVDRRIFADVTGSTTAGVTILFRSESVVIIIVITIIFIIIFIISQNYNET